GRQVWRNTAFRATVVGHGSGTPCHRLTDSRRKTVRVSQSGRSMALVFVILALALGGCGTSGMGSRLQASLLQKPSAPATFAAAPSQPSPEQPAEFAAVP